MQERTNERVKERTKERQNERTNERRTDQRTELTNEQSNEQTKKKQTEQNQRMIGINEWISNPKNEPGAIDWLIDFVIFCDQQRTLWTLVWHQAVERKMTTKTCPSVNLHLMTRTTNRWPGLVLGFRLLPNR